MKPTAHILALLLLGALSATGQGSDTLSVFPRAFEVGVGQNSLVPPMVVLRYSEGVTTDVTANATVVSADPAVAVTVSVLYSEGDDSWPYTYVRGVAPGATTLTVSAVGLSVQVPVEVRPSPPPVAPLDSTPMDIGSHLADLSNHSSELVFTDVFMTSARWVSSTAGGGWDDFGQPLDLDSRGWVRSLLPGQAADTLMLIHLGGHFPKGSYTLTWQGSGTLSVEHWFSGQAFPRIDHADLGTTHVAEIVIGPADNDGVRLRILASDPALPVENIRLWMPDAVSGVNPANADVLPSDPFLASFVESVGRYRVLRFGNWQLSMDGSDNLSVVWGDRTRLDAATQNTANGVALEWPIRLLNRINRSCDAPIDGWFNIPYLASDEWIRRFAELLATTVDFDARPDLRIFIEWANEVWNPAFLHRGYASSQGLALDLDLGTGDELVAAMGFQAYRSLQVFAIFEDVFTITHPVPGGMARLRRVLAGAAGVPSHSHTLISMPGAAAGVDVFAIAPYFGNSPAVAVNQLPDGSLPTVDEFLDNLDNPLNANNLSMSDLEQRIREIAHHRALVESWSAATGKTIDLVGYESGQHLVGQGFLTEAHVVGLFTDANNHPRMGDMYRRLFTAWRDLGGAEIVHFINRERWWTQGFFGALQWYDDDEITLPTPHKYRALLDAMAPASLIFCDGFEPGNTSSW